MINFPEEIVLLAKTSDVSVKHPVRLEKLMRFKNYHMFRDLLVNDGKSVPRINLNITTSS